MSETSSVETEVKLSIPHSLITARLHRLSAISSFPLGDRRVVRVVDTFKDTADFKLMRAGLALRERRAGDDYQLTVKGLSGGDRRVHRREEVEQKASKPLTAEMAKTADGPVFRRIRPIVGQAALSDLFRFEQERTIRPLFDGECHRADVYLDSVTMTRGGSTETFYEIEVESTGGCDRTMLTRIERWLSDAFGLRTERRTKFERALSFFDVRLPAEVAAALEEAQTADVAVSPTDSLADSLTSLLQGQIDELRRQESSILHEPTVDAVHDMRVAAQRARVLLSIPSSKHSGRKEFIAFLKQLRLYLGAVRDLHVIPRTVARATRNSAPAAERSALSAAASAALESLVQTAEAESVQRLDGYLRSESYRSSRRQFLDRGYCIRSADVRRLPSITRDAVPVLLLNRIALADAWHRRLRPGSPADLHELRKLLKAVRYLLEFFEPLVENAGLVLRDAAIGVQTPLGVLQDVQVARQFVGSRLDHESVTIDVALGALAASAEEEAADAWVEFCNPDLRLPVFEELMRS